MFRALKVVNGILKWILYFTGSQWRMWRTGVRWSRRGLEVSGGVLDVLQFVGDFVWSTVEYANRVVESGNDEGMDEGFSSSESIF